ncbi:MAG: HlyC/CorC family transporter [Inquilinus sp.]|nr:HlyC/CorC family transporter [Inquilinus sp.]
MALCLAVEAFFSGSEIGVVSADRMKLRHEAAQGSRGAALALEMLNKPEWLLSTTLVGTNIAVVANTTLATALMIDLFGERYSWLAIVIVAPLIWIFGEIVAKSVFQQRADAITPKAIYVLRAASFLFSPILAVFSFLTRLLTKLFGGEAASNPFTLREEIAAMMEMSAVEGDIPPMERHMIRRVFNFGETTAGDIMVPLIDVIGIAREATCGEARRLAVEHAHKRLPVYEERVDRVVGTLNVLDLLREDPERPIAPYIRETRYVPDSTSVEKLLSDVRKGSGFTAVVVDEHGGAEGIVMLEDILEVIVGELEDEFDQPKSASAWIRELGERDYLVEARVKIGLLEETLGIELPAGKYDTLAGFLIETTKAIPPAGAVIRHDGISFTVERVTMPTILEVRVRW